MHRMSFSQNVPTLLSHPSSEPSPLLSKQSLLSVSAPSFLSRTEPRRPALVSHKHQIPPMLTLPESLPCTHRVHRRLTALCSHLDPGSNSTPLSATTAASLVSSSAVLSSAAAPVSSQKGAQTAPVVAAAAVSVAGARTGPHIAQAATGAAAQAAPALEEAFKRPTEGKRSTEGKISSEGVGKAMGSSAPPVTDPPSLRNWVTADGTSQFPAESGRYHLYVSLACPWASRCYMALKMKGLENAIGVTITKPVWEKTRPGEAHTGWAFGAPGEGDPPCPPGEGQEDPLNHALYVRDLYELVHPGYTKFSVPVLWDKEQKTIVNNESADILRMLNSEFNRFAENKSLDLYPKALQSEIDGVNEWVGKSINSGAYRVGNAANQAEYDKALDELYGALDRCEGILAHQRYLVGSSLTEADVRLFVSLIRFDEAYVVYFRCNRKMIHEYPNLFNYLKDIYQTPGVKDTVSMWHIKQYHFLSHPEKNPSGIVPGGPNIDYTAPHDRNRFSPAAEGA